MRWTGALAALGLASVLASSCSAPRRTTPDPSPPSGPHDATSHHSFEDVEHWVSIFDDPKRDAWQKPEALVAALKIRPGQTVADLGTGTGYFLRWLSPAVGPSGRVYAVDTEPKLLDHVRQRAETEGWTNVSTVRCPPDAPGLPDGSADLILIVDTWHHIDARLSYLARLRRAMAPGGRVAVVDFRKDRTPPPGPPQAHRLDRSVVVEEFRSAGWTLAEEPPVLDEQYVLVFQPS